MLNRETRGLVLICNLRGEVEEVLSDTVGMSLSALSGALFASVLAPGSFSKGMNLLREVQSRGTAFDWELDLETESGLVSLYFQGLRRDNRVFLIGSTTRSESLDLQHDLLAMNNQHVTALRSALKELQAERSRTMTGDHSLFNELTRLNSELANAQRELVRNNTELERLSREKTRFLGMAAHDLRTPLGAITAYAGFLEEDAGALLNEEQREFLSTIQESSRFMLHLINELLDLSTIESGNLTLKCELCDLPALLRHSMMLNRTLASRKSIRLDLHLDTMSPNLSLDPSKIEQVLNNLIGNAVKFSPPGETITVSAEPCGDEVVISVADHGPGIPAAELQRIFVPFQKGSVRPTAGESSTGLGLAISKRIVEGHEGRIWVESQVGLGSTFYISLPKAKAAKAERAAAGQPAAMPY